MVERSKFQSFIPVILFLILSVISYLIVEPFVLVIILAALLAYTVSPVHNWMVKKTKRPNVSAFLMCFLVLLLLILPATYMVKSLAEESYMIYNAVQRNNLLEFEDCTSNLCRNIANILSSPQVSFQIEKASSSFTNYLITKTSELVLSIPTLLINLFVFLFTLFYFLRDGQGLVDRLGYYLSVQKKHYAIVVSRLKQATQGIIYGYVLVAFIQGALGTLGFLVLGVPSPFFWGMMMAFLSLIPYGGAGIVWGPAALIMLFLGMQKDNTWMIVKGIILFVYGVFVISGIDNILRPRIISGKAKIHPGIILVGMLGGLYFFGAFGVIIGPLVLALTAIIIETYLGKTPNKKELNKVLKVKGE